MIMITRALLALMYSGWSVIMAFSVVVSICFLKHKNMLLPVFLHMLYDFMLEIFAA